MSRVRRAWQALTGGVDAKHSAVVTSPRSRGDIGPYRTVNRDRAIEATNAPPGNRQIWQLHRAREECRDLALRSGVLAAWLKWARDNAVGDEPARLKFTRFSKDQSARLAEPARYLQREFMRHQLIPGIGGRGQTVHQMAGQVLYHVLIDGDCFVRRRRGDGGRVWDLMPGDALAESQTTMGSRGGKNVTLGVETDRYGKPIAYHVGEGGSPRFNWNYAPYASSTNAERVLAKHILHIRDRSAESTAARGWPWPTAVIGLIAREDEWLEALARAATLRASIGLALQNKDGYGEEDLGEDPYEDRTRSVGEETAEGSADQFSGGEVRPYQEFAAKAGSMMKIEAGWELVNIDTGSPTSNEIEGIATVLRLISSALRCSPATLFGDYKSISFSSAQAAHIQERQGIEYMQMILANQYYSPLYADWLLPRWTNVVAEFPEIDPVEDFDALLNPTMVLRKYPVVDKGRLVKPMMEGFNQGILDLAEVRAELGYSGVDLESFIERWKEHRRALGLPETPTEKNAAPPGDKDDDDGDDGRWRRRQGRRRWR